MPFSPSRKAFFYTSTMELEILFEDEHYIAVNKPAGMMVHRSSLAKDETVVFALQVLRDQIGQKVHPVHRIDRPTSGLLWFAKSREAVAPMQQHYVNHSIEKYYLAIVRGYTKSAEALVDHPLKKQLTKELQEAQTAYKSLARVEIPVQSSPMHQTSRYSLIRAFPHTGRMHQIRRHMAHERNYIIGDTTHGDNRQNRFFRSHFDRPQMLLHAWNCKFAHPYTQQPIEVHASLPQYYEKLFREFGWNESELGIHIGEGKSI